MLLTYGNSKLSGIVKTRNGNQTNRKEIMSVCNKSVLTKNAKRMVIGRLIKALTGSF